MRDQIIQAGVGAPQLREYLRVLKRRARSIVVVTVLVIAAAGAVSFVLPPKYVSTAKVLVKPVALVSGQPDNTIAPNMATEQEVASSTSVAELAEKRLNLTLTQEQLTKSFLKNLKVATNNNTEILEFSYTARTPSIAQSRAGAFAQAYLDFRLNQVVDSLTSASVSFQQRIDALNTQLVSVQRQLAAARDVQTRATLQVQLNSLNAAIAGIEGNLGTLVTPSELDVGDIVQAANLPDRPANSHVRDLVLATFVGFALAIGVAFLRDRLDDRLRGRDEVETAIRAPVLGVLPFRPRRGVAGLSLASSREQGAVPDAFRALRTGMLFVASRMSAKTIVVTSPLPEDGKTTTVANLGLSLAQAGKKVILVSADLRRPRLHQLFGCSNDVGLTSVLAGERVPWEALVALQTPNLLLLPSGPSPSNVIDLLDSAAMRGLLDEFRSAVDFVLVDTGPVVGTADTIALAPLVDAVMVVVNGQQTTRSAANRTRKQLELVNARMMGTVLYDPADESEYGYYYYSYSAPEPEPSGNGSLYHAPAPRIETSRDMRARSERAPEPRSYEPRPQEPAPRAPEPARSYEQRPAPEPTRSYEQRPAPEPAPPRIAEPSRTEDEQRTIELDVSPAVQHPFEGV